MCMSESPQLTLAGSYKLTVNESETINAAQRAGGLRGGTNGFPGAPVRPLERS